MTYGLNQRIGLQIQYSGVGTSAKLTWWINNQNGLTTYDYDQTLRGFFIKPRTAQPDSALNNW